MPRRPDQSSAPVQHAQDGRGRVANNVDELQREMGRLMEEHIESLKKHTFVPRDDEQIEADEKRLKHIREVSSDYLAAMGKTNVQTGGESMSEKPSVKLPGKVEKVIKSVADEPEKAQIAIEGADPLYREIRIENTLKDIDGEEVHLKRNDEVDITVEADKVPADKAKSEEDAEEKDDLVA